MNDDTTGPENLDLLGSTAEIVAAYVGQNQIMQGDLPALIRSVHQALAGISEPLAVVEELTPAVPIKKSVTDDYIICLEDGAKLKVLKRYLRTHFNLTPDEYRAKWNLPKDYPMVAAGYARTRSEMAKSIGLGRQAPTTGRGRKKRT